MKIKYTYKDFETDDVRDIVYNNKLEENTKYIFSEYLPYQVFISRDTFFKDLKIKVDEGFYPEKQVPLEKDFLLEDSFKEYFSDHIPIRGYYAAACSGGIDSSVVSLLTKPDLVYTGYYSEPGYSEVPFATLIAEKINSKHFVTEITEEDYIKSIDDFLKNICVPIGGMGGISEYICLKRMREAFGMESVLFGNGGDEVFLGYFYNHMILYMMDVAETEHTYMENFKPARRSFVYDNIDIFIERLINRGYAFNGTSAVTDRLKNNANFIDKMFDININVTLPSLLHLNNQMCKAMKVEGYNPLSNQKLFDRAVSINKDLSEKTKKALIDMCPELPQAIVDRKDKFGFPIPYHKWDVLNAMMREAVEKTGEAFNGINRRSWGIFMIDRWRRVFN